MPRHTYIYTYIHTYIACHDIHTYIHRTPAACGISTPAACKQVDAPAQTQVACCNAQPHFRWGSRVLLDGAAIAARKGKHTCMDGDEHRLGCWASRGRRRSLGWQEVVGAEVKSLHVQHVLMLQGLLHDFMHVWAT